MSRWVPAALGLLVTGCASLWDGQHQEVAVYTDPPGAACTLGRGGVTIAWIAETPGHATIRKSKDDFAIVCRRSGYLDTATTAHSGAY
jgi:hypothetical protein